LTSTLFFSHFDQYELKKIEKELEVFNLPAGETLLRQGDPGDSLYVLINGRLKVFVNFPDGSQKAVGEVVRGESDGEMAILTEEKRSATVKAIRDSQLVKLSKDSFFRLAETNPKIITTITKLIVKRLRKTIQTPTQSEKHVERISSIAIVPITNNVPMNDFIRILEKALSQFGNLIRINRNTIDNKFGQDSTQNVFGNTELIEWLNIQELQHTFIIYESDSQVSKWTQRCIRHADCVLLVANSNMAPFVSGIEKEFLNNNAQNIQAQKQLILLNQFSDSKPENTAEWLKLRNVDNHHHIRVNSVLDFERLARRLTGRGIGLVLGGGGARGIAHMGVIRALEEYEIPIDIVGGTSAGAFVAAMYALGYNSQEMMEFNHKFLKNTKKYFDYTFPLVSLLTAKSFSNLLIQIFGETRIEDLWMKLFCVSSNLTHADLMIHEEGPLWSSVRASMSLPGIVPPVIADGHILIDGSVLDNLPVDIMKNFSHGGPVIAVDVGIQDDLSHVSEYGTSLSGWKLFWDKMKRTKQDYKVPNILDILIRTSM